MNSHEIFIDNDVLFHAESESINKFLRSKDMTFITTGFGNNGKGNYGKYFDLVQDHTIPVNSGVFGLPPYFPFSELIKKYQNHDKDRFWNDYFDEQGLVACCVLNHINKLIIPMSEINLCVSSFKSALSAYHFAGVNKGYLEVWNYFIKNKIKIL